MRVTFKTNLGTIDAEAIEKRHGVKLDCKQCQYGNELDLDSEVAAELVERGVAVAKQSTIKAVPAEPVKAVPEEGSVEKATADLEAYREKQTKPAKKTDAKESSKK